MLSLICRALAHRNTLLFCMVSGIKYMSFRRPAHQILFEQFCPCIQGMFGLDIDRRLVDPTLSIISFGQASNDHCNPIDCLATFASDELAVL